jgi:hypothetical protein
MGSFCFSSASILRCIPVSRTQAEILIIPAAVEIIFSTTLVIAKFGDGRYVDTFLCCDAGIYDVGIETGILANKNGNVKADISHLGFVDRAESLLVPQKAGFHLGSPHKKLGHLDTNCLDSGNISCWPQKDGYSSCWHFLTCYHTSFLLCGIQLRFLR